MPALVPRTPDTNSMPPPRTSDVILHDFACHDLVPWTIYTASHSSTRTSGNLHGIPTPAEHEHKAFHRDVSRPPTTCPKDYACHYHVPWATVYTTSHATDLYLGQFTRLSLLQQYPSRPPTQSVPIVPQTNTNDKSKRPRIPILRTLDE